MVVRCLCSIGCVRSLDSQAETLFVGLCARLEVNGGTHEWRGTRVQGVVYKCDQTKSSHNAENLIIYDVRAKCENNVVLHPKRTHAARV